MELKMAEATSEALFMFCSCSLIWSGHQQTRRCDIAEAIRDRGRFDGADWLTPGQRKDAAKRVTFSPLLWHCSPWIQLVINGGLTY